MALTIKQLADFIKNKIPTNTLTIKGEIRQPKFSGGHLYMIMKDNTANISCVIWKTKVTDIIKNLKDGDMIEAKGNLDYYAPRGEIKFIISTVVKDISIGDMFAEFDKMKTEFKNLGYFNKKIKLPEVIRRIAILTSKTGAAIHDFIHNLDNNKCMVEYDIIDMVVQGSECPGNIVEYLNKNDMTKYDMVIITRGGGSIEDLWGFNDKSLIETIYNRNYVTLSAIGHMVDTTLLDFVSDISCATPSLAAQYIVDYNKQYIEKLNSIKTKYYNYIINDIHKELNNLTRYENIKYEFNETLKNKMINYKQDIIHEIRNKLMRLDMLKEKYKEHIGFYDNNKKLEYNEFKDIVNSNKPFTIVWNNIVINVNNYN